jgi:hypothetical protein
MMTQQIPGVPEGWELVELRRARKGEYYVDGEGRPQRTHADLHAVWPIIRKIEKPARYRPFKDAEEFKPHRDRWIKLTVAESDGVYYTFRVVSYDDWGVVFGGSKETYQAVFSRYVFDDDGTPFGVKIDE